MAKKYFLIVLVSVLAQAPAVTATLANSVIKWQNSVTADGKACVLYKTDGQKWVGIFSDGRSYPSIMVSLSNLTGMSNNKSIRITFKVDEMNPWRGNSKIYNSNLKHPLPSAGVQQRLNKTIFRQIKNGRVLKILILNRNLHISLEGSSEGLSLLLACAKDLKTRSSSGPKSRKSFERDRIDNNPFYNDLPATYHRG